MRSRQTVNHLRPRAIAKLSHLQTRRRAIEWDFGEACSTFACHAGYVRCECSEAHDLLITPKTERMGSIMVRKTRYTRGIVLGAGIDVNSVTMGFGNLTRPCLICFLKALRSLGRMQMQKHIFYVVSGMSLHILISSSLELWYRRGAF